MSRMILIVCLFACAASARADEHLFVANQNNNSAELINLVTLQSLAVTPVGAQPLTAAVSRDGRYGMIASVGNFSGANANGNLTIVDLATAGMPVVTTLSPGSRVYSVAVSPDSKTAYIGRETAARQIEFVRVDLTANPPVITGTPLTIPNAASAYDIEITPDGVSGYFLDLSRNTLTIIDLSGSTPQVLQQLTVVASSIFMDLSNDGRRLAIMSWTQNAAEIWNTESAVPVREGSVSVGSNPGAIPSFEPGNQFCLAVAAGGGSAHVFDAHTMPPAALGTVGSVGSDLRGAAASRTGLSGWAASRTQNRLIEIDLSTPAMPRLTNRTITVARGPNSLVAFGQVHASGVAAVGSPYPVNVSSPVDAGRAYVLGASFDSRPGIPLGTRSVPLALDPLFTLSQTVPAIFQNFQGVLDMNGQAVAVINVPNVGGLAGFSFVVAGVIIDSAAPQGVSTVTNAEHIVLQ